MPRIEINRYEDSSTLIVEADTADEAAAAFASALDQCPEVFLSKVQGDRAATGAHGADRG